MDWEPRVLALILGFYFPTEVPSLPKTRGKQGPEDFNEAAYRILGDITDAGLLP